MPWSRIKIFTAMLAVCLNAGWSAIADTTPPQEYLKWLETLKKEMAERGISQATLDEAFFRNYYQANHKVIKQDRNQSEFVLTTSAYLKRLITPQRVKQGREAYKKLKKRYGENIFGVPLPYLIAFWGVETNFGSNKGGYSAIESLTILSYDKRRPKFFREELYHALKILDNKHIALREMESSWAGAMGHFQFMPSTFSAYAIDGDNDGKIDIWNNFNDAIASAANYLAKMGWKHEEPWGIPINLDWNFNYEKSGRHYIKTVAKWQKKGVEVTNVDKHLRGAIIVPEGHRGQAYLVFDNFRTIMQWNKSENYALAVGLLADRIKNPQLSAEITVGTPYRLQRKDVKEVQKFIKQHKIADIHVDGNLGSKTREAVKKLQIKFKLPPDGYIDDRLLNNIKSFSERGYYPPLPSRKLHRGK